MNADITAFLGLMAKLQSADEDINPEALLDAGSKINFDAEAGTGRSERLTATVPVMVKKVLPNGNLFVEGHRVILVNNEEHHFYVSGVARPYDIDESNSVPSSRLADAEIEFTGRGVLSEGQKPGPVARFFGWIWPF
jgi:flagellar L-ring protein precursor FlgH